MKVFNSSRIAVIREGEEQTMTTIEKGEFSENKQANWRWKIYPLEQG